MPLRVDEPVLEPEEPQIDAEELLEQETPFKNSVPYKPTNLSPSKQELREKALAEIERRKEWSVSPLY